MSDKLNTEQLIRTRLDGAELTPSPQSWSAIQQKLRWPQFLRFNPGRFNIYYAGALLLATAGLVLLLTGERDRSEPTIPEEKTNTLSSIESSAEDIAGELVDKSKSTENATTNSGMHPETPTTPSQNKAEPVNERATEGLNTGQGEEDSESSQKK